MVTITLDPDYGYVILAATPPSSSTSSTALTRAPTAKPPKSTIPPPTRPLAHRPEKAHRFNCAQRAHANFTENQLDCRLRTADLRIAVPKTAGCWGAWSLKVHE
ncbi:hypothetical protein DID88_006547 [Monilinia fructigena]|uniref:Uncharacterized protein n=1 Tax=Monilinia fructigena TaxID=38457 RepID=A0A395IJM7_9HELO|nr:hypothetical protein DID88_006547 [Monilinia fructigena]